MHYFFGAFPPLEASGGHTTVYWFIFWGVIPEAPVDIILKAAIFIILGYYIF